MSMAENGKLTIAILALQGAFAEHREALEKLGVDTFEVRQPKDWQKDKDGLIVPGGESTTQMRLLDDLGLTESIRSDIAEGLPVWGTCAGMILLAKYEDGKPRRGLSTMDIDVCRNAYGRQLGSFHATGRMAGVADNLPITFIRAPYVRKTTDGSVEILSEVDGRIVAARQGNQLATAFHPELTDDTRVHQYFVDMIMSRND